MDIFRFDLDHLARTGHPAGKIAGVDEVGRGSLAGPLVAAGVVLDYCGTEGTEGGEEGRNPAGFHRDGAGLGAEKLIRGDALSAAVAAASVVAKVMRDRLMISMHDLYPHYGFDRNKGYGTLEHRVALHTFGPSPLHRLSFSGVGAQQLTLG